MIEFTRKIEETSNDLVASNCPRRTKVNVHIPFNEMCCPCSLSNGNEAIDSQT